MKKIMMTTLMMITSCGILTIWGQKRIYVKYNRVQTVVFADNANIHYTGRFSFKNKKAPCMVYPGSMIEMNFTGTSLCMKAKPNSGFFMVTIDNDNPIKINFTKNDSILTLVKGLKNGKHNCKVMLAYEGYLRKPEFKGFILDKSAKIIPYINHYKLKIEFIGNSITCGYGIEAHDKMIHFSDSTENHYYTYAGIVARRLNAESMVVARSGIGAYRNYNGPKSGEKDVMPRWYDYTLLYDSTEVWTNKCYKPDIVCINLGTNDLSTPNYDIQLYKSAYKSFVQHLRRINPKSKIVMLTGCILNGKPLMDQKKVLDEIKQELSDDGIYRFDFTPMNGSLGYGADYHPSILQGRKMADELVSYFQRHLLIL